MIHLMQGDHARSVEEATKALEFHVRESISNVFLCQQPNYFLANLARGHSLFALEQPAKAIEDFSRFLAAATVAGGIEV